MNAQYIKAQFENVVTCIHDGSIYVFSNLNAEVFDSPYNHIYGRLPIPTRGYIPTGHRTPMYVDPFSMK
ncbi:MH2 domain-containing protein [Aphis craccivora]|uniref:MH2 domain-containing protein n=1 Tax=Aphis craccivora TaxID=307492 RepID=A0A6G0ZPR4_APHCR|nr:MH2 domain-containing protein [Aphis craccivora]